jgi:hypothetical protein
MPARINHFIRGKGEFIWSGRLFDQARKQEFSGGMRAGQETSNDSGGAPARPFLAGKKWTINEGAIGFVAVEETFFEEAIEGGHYGGVGKRATEIGDDVADAGFAARPEEFR